ncbi:MAG: hypothetical protein DMG61_00260 [Acidobacteria bacterium]|nr:MAG: hypothetical protein DMG61_00260 [Acidobacteriota bacterium]
MANHITFFGQIGGVTRQCSLCDEFLVVNASSKDLDSADAHHLWSVAFQRHIQERHSSTRSINELETCPTIRII